MKSGRLSPGQWVGIGLFVIYLGLPLLATLLFSLAERWTSTILPERWSLSAYEDAFGHREFLPTIARSIILAALVVVGTLLLTVPALLAVHLQRLSRVRRALELLTVLPFAIPGVVMALGLIRLYGNLPFQFTGTPAILIAAHMMISLPFMFWAVDNNLRAIKVRVLVEAAYTLGATWPTVLLRVIVPSMAPGLISGSVLVFTASFGEFTLANLLVGAAWRTLPIWQYNTMRVDGHLTAALSVISFIVTWGASLVVAIIASRNELRLDVAAIR